MFTATVRRTKSLEDLNLCKQKRIKKPTILTKWETYQTPDFFHDDDDDHEVF